jgi:hypothetical protein
LVLAKFERGLGVKRTFSACNFLTIIIHACTRKAGNRDALFVCIWVISPAAATSTAILLLPSTEIHVVRRSFRKEAEII